MKKVIFTMLESAFQNARRKAEAARIDYEKAVREMEGITMRYHEALESERLAREQHELKCGTPFSN